MHATTALNSHHILDKLKNKQELNGDEKQFILNQTELLDKGSIRSAFFENDKWTVNTEAKATILAFLRMHSSKLITSHPGCYDKAPLKFETWSETDFEQHGIRAVPGSIVRKGAYIGKQVVLMPCFVNMGAYIDTGTMIDTHASVGSCAQVGRHCHISGGAGIGGVLEPEGALPTIIEDNCFIGARSEIAEGVVVGKGSVIAMGVYISASTKIFNTEDQSISYGYIPPYSVVVPGSIPYKGANIYCAMIIKQVTESTRKKTSINELLR